MCEYDNTCYTNIEAGGMRFDLTCLHKSCIAQTLHGRVICEMVFFGHIYIYFRERVFFDFIQIIEIKMCEHYSSYTYI